LRYYFNTTLPKPKKKEREREREPATKRERKKNKNIMLGGSLHEKHCEKVIRPLITFLDFLGWMMYVHNIDTPHKNTQDLGFISLVNLG